MTTKQDAKEKIAAASRGCEAAESEWRKAAAALDTTISTNGYGIHHDRHELRYKLIDARERINAAIAQLEKIEWPGNADYDLAD